MKEKTKTEEEITESLITFNRSIKQRIKELSEQSEDCVSLKDESKGVCVQINSSKLPPEQLLNLCACGFDFILSRRGSKTPVGIN